MTPVKKLFLATLFAASALAGCQTAAEKQADAKANADKKIANEQAAEKKIEMAGLVYQGSLGKFFNPHGMDFDSYVAMDKKDSSKYVVVIAAWDDNAVVDIKPMNPANVNKPSLGLK